MEIVAVITLLVLHRVTNGPGDIFRLFLSIRSWNFSPVCVLKIKDYLLYTL